MQRNGVLDYMQGDIIILDGAGPFQNDIPGPSMPYNKLLPLPTLHRLLPVIRPADMKFLQFLNMCMCLKMVAGLFRSL